MTAPPRKPCGTYAAYRRGCRCAPCVEAFRLYESQRPKRPMTPARRAQIRRGIKRHLAKLQAETIPSAHRNGHQWTDSEMELVGRTDIPVADLAKILGRSYSACDAARSRLKEPNRDKELQARHQAETVPTAHRNGYPWTGAEMELVARTDIPLYELAKMLGRSYAACRRIRGRLKEPNGEYMAGLSRKTDREA